MGDKQPVAGERPPDPFQAPQWLDLAEALLDQLRGRMSLIQPAEERHQFVTSALDHVYAQQPDRFPRFASEDMRRAFVQAFLSYGLIEAFLADPSVEDIIINANETIFLHRTGEGLVKTDRRFATSRELDLFVQKLIVFGGHAQLGPINDVELSDIRGRVNIIQSPFGPQITITRGKPQPLTILQLIENGTLSHELAGQLWMYVEGLRVRPANLIITGGPGAGKTTLLNAILSFIPWNDRLVTIEDTLELNTSFLENCSRLESDSRMDLAALVKNSLRMRPERILVGEVRGAEARDMMTAMNIGKYCTGTLHASSARETILRMENEPMNVPSGLIGLVDVFVIIRKLSKDGRVARKVYELVETAGMEKRTVLLSTVWNYDHQQQEAFEEMPSSTYRDRLATESGLSPVAIMDETARRADILRLMHEGRQFPDIAAVTRFCQLYSAQPEEALRRLGASAAKLARR